MQEKNLLGSIILTFRNLIVFFAVVLIFNGCGEKSSSYKPFTTLASLPPASAILFVSDRDTGTRQKEIYAMEADGSNVTRITTSNGHHHIIGIDPTKRYIVASRAERDTDAPAGLGDEDRRSLWVYDLDTGQANRLTDIANHAEGDSFSLDSEWIVFLMKVPGEDPDIYKIRRDGTDLTQLTNTLTASEGDPEFSHDGTEIAFTYLNWLGTQRFVLKKMDADGGNITEIYDGGPGVLTLAFPPGNYDPSWSPDDQSVVFERAVQYTEGDPENWGSGIWHIFKVNTDGTGLVDLSLSGSHDDRAEYLPSFSPDGLLVIFGSIYEAADPLNSHVDIFTMDASSGGPLIRLTTDSSNMFAVFIP